MRKRLSYSSLAYRRLFKLKPWIKTYRSIMNRCVYQIGTKLEAPHYKKIKNFLTKEDLKILWFRDKGYEMTRPSIDRIDSSKHYTIENCRYLELSINSANGGRNNRKN